MTGNLRPDWLVAQLRGKGDGQHEPGSLAWYVDQARGGDQQAARRAVGWMAESLTPAALQQNGGFVDPALAPLLHELLATIADTGDSEILRTARQGPSHRPPDHNKAVRVWWACVRMHQLIAATPKLSQAAAACSVAADDGGWIEGSSLAKRYRALSEAIVLFEADQAALVSYGAKTSDKRPPTLPP